MVAKCADVACHFILVGCHVTQMPRQVPFLKKELFNFLLLIFLNMPLGYPSYKFSHLVRVLSQPIVTFINLPKVKPNSLPTWQFCVFLDVTHNVVVFFSMSLGTSLLYRTSTRSTCDI